jgi:hypothetical protein
MKCCIGHEKITVSKDRKLFLSALNVKFGSLAGLAFVGAECGVPKMKIFIKNHPACVFA